MPALGRGVAVGQVAQAVLAQPVEERRADEPVHQLDRRRVGHRRDDADVGAEEQLEHHRVHATGEIEHDPVARQLAHLGQERLGGRQVGVGDPRRIRGAADEPHARHRGRHRQVGQRRAVGDQRFGQRPGRPGHAAEQVQVGRAQRAVDHHDLLAQRGQEDAEVGGDQALANAALAAADGDHLGLSGCHRGAHPSTDTPADGRGYSNTITCARHGSGPARRSAATAAAGLAPAARRARSEAKNAAA